MPNESTLSAHSEHRMPATSPFDLLAEELGAVAGRIERETAYRFAALAADIQRQFAERELQIERLQKQLESVVGTNILGWDKFIKEKVASLRDGIDGIDGEDGVDGKDGADGVEGKQGLPGELGPAGPQGPAGELGPAGPQGVQGLRGDQGERGEMGPAGADGMDGAPGLDGKDGASGERGPEGPAGLPGLPGMDGKDGLNGQDGAAGKDGMDGAIGPVGPAGRDGVDGLAGKDGVIGADGLRGDIGPAGPAGEKGMDGINGKDGAPGKLPKAKAWTAGVHYEADVCTHKGGLYQAERDTAGEPGTDAGVDWICLARAGRDGKDGGSLNIRDTYVADVKYKALDVVTLDSKWFVARCDNPGVCPGPDWKAGPGIGKTGRPGERGGPGERGLKGDKGETVEIITWEINHESYEVTPIMSDGERGPVLGLRKLFAQFHDERRN